MTSKEILAARQSLKLTQAGLAAALGVSAQVVSFWENDRRKISTTAAKLLRLYTLKPGLLKLDI